MQNQRQLQTIEIFVTELKSIHSKRNERLLLKNEESVKEK